MDGLLARIGVDAVQFRALFRAQGTLRGLRRYLAMLLVYGLPGVMFGAMALFVPDVFVSGVLALSGVMFLVASSVLIEFGAVVISPLDYDVLGYQPVSSRTYFAVRLANVLTYTTLTTTMLGGPAMAAYFFARGFNPVLGLAGVAAFLLAGTFTTMAIIAVYVAVAQAVHPQKLRRTLTYLQLVLTFGIYAGYFLLPRLFSPSALKTWTIPKSGWMTLYPPAWFASYLELAVGRRSLLEVAPGFMGIAALAVVAWVATARLSLGYSELLSRQMAKSEGDGHVRRRFLPLAFLRDERRAMALLLAAQFRDDQRFRLAVLTIIPMTVFYLILGVQQGGLRDPFDAPASSGDGSLLYFAMLLFPMMLLGNISRSDAYRAAWVFYVTPARRAELVLAARDLVVAYVLGPYVVGLALVLSYLFGNPLHAFLHVLVQALYVNLMLLVVIALQPALPFSKPVEKGRASALFMTAILIGTAVQAASSVFLSRAVYPRPMVLAGVIAGLLLVGIGGEALLRLHLQRSSFEKEFLA